MNLEGRKFHFARDEEDGRIYAQYEIETEVANREGWLLPPKKGDKRVLFFKHICGTQRLEVTFEATGELDSAGVPAYRVVETKEARESFFDSQETDNIDEGLQKIISNFAILCRSLHVSSSGAAIKLLNAIRSFALTGACDSNADEDSVCGGICETCRAEEDESVGCNCQNT